MTEENRNLDHLIFTAQDVEKYLDTDFPVQVDVQREVTSTNTILKSLAEQGMPEGFVLIAQAQTAGRGRLGRSFHSPIGTGLYFSVLLRPDCSAERSLFITTAAAVAVCKAIEKLTDKKPLIKWVNDLYFNEKKICGILTEASVNYETKGLNWAVLGIGINLAEPEGGFPEDIRTIAGSLFCEKCPADMAARLAAEVLNQFFRLYKDMETGAFIDEYRSRSFLTGREIVFSRGNETFSGIVTGISEEAHLLVRLSSGEEQAFSAGEVQIHKGFQKQ